MLGSREGEYSKKQSSSRAITTQKAAIKQVLRAWGGSSPPFLELFHHRTFATMRISFKKKKIKLKGICRTQMKCHKYLHQSLPTQLPASAPAGCITCSWGWCHPFPAGRLQLLRRGAAAVPAARHPPRRQQRSQQRCRWQTRSRWGGLSGGSQPKPALGKHRIQVGFHSYGTCFSFQSTMCVHVWHVFVLLLSLSTSSNKAFLFEKCGD